MSVREIRILYGEAQPGEHRDGPVRIKDARSIVAVVRPLLEQEACEVGYVLCLTTKLDLIGYHEVSRGSLDSALMHPREIFKAAVMVNAASIVLAHNHPSGDPSPSVEDLALTTRLREAGRLIGIELLDHIIVGHDGRFTSLKELGRI
jgi:DNA repair protein RadC